MRRTDTTKQSSFTRSGFVTYDLSASTNESTETTITVPQGSKWTSGLHWHEAHTEYLQVVQGVALVTLNGSTRNFTSADGIITVPRFARHEWGRADTDESEIGSLRSTLPELALDLIVKEWTDPADGQKEIFFRNLSSVISDYSADGPPNESWLTLQLFVIFATLDNYPVLYSGPRSLQSIAGGIEWAITHFALFLATWVGSFLGLRAFYDEYTPSRLLRGNVPRDQSGSSKKRLD